MGAEISRALEQDAALGVNGVVAEDATAARDGSKQSVRRSAADAARRAKLFAFCRDWKLERVVDFLRWYTHFALQARRGAGVAGLGIADVVEGAGQADRLAGDVAALDALLRQLELEIEDVSARQIEDAADNEEQAGDERGAVNLAETIGELQTRKHGVELELKAKKARLSDLKLHLMASLDGVDFRQALQWPIFMKAMTQVQLQGDATQIRRLAAEWHPACDGFEMRRHDSGKSQLEEYNKGDIVVPPPASHEIDGHTDDSASSSAASEGEEGEDENEESDEEADHEEDSSPKPDKVAAATTEEAANEDSDESDEEEVPISASSTNPVPSPATSSENPQAAESIADSSKTKPDTVPAIEGNPEKPLNTESAVAMELLAFKQSLKNPRIVKRPVPEVFNPETRHPVFFGYTTNRQNPFVNETVKEQAALDEREKAIFAAKIDSRRAELNSTIKAEQSKLESFDQRERDLVAKREKHWEKRSAELERAKKELDPNDIYFRTHEAQDKRAKEQEAFDDEEVRRLRQNTEARIKAAQEQCEKAIDYIHNLQATDKPQGEVRLMYHEKEMERHQIDVNEAKRALDAAREEYVALKTTKIRIPGQDAKNRAQLLFAEDQIKSREATLERVCATFENEQFLFQRAQQILEREQHFVPVYNCVTQAKQYDPKQTKQRPNVTLLDVAVLLLLGVGACPVSSKSKLLFDMFSRRSEHPRYTKSDNTVSAVHILPADAFGRVAQLLVESMTRLGDIQLPQSLSGEFFQSIADREFLNLGLGSAPIEPEDNQDEERQKSAIPEISKASKIAPGMTYYEFHKYCVNAIEKSRYLCLLLHHPWQYEQLSRFVIQHMSVTQQYSLGLINLNDLKYSVARQLIQPRAELSRWKRIVIHERALAMGENDPLKTDYSKYLPRRRAKLLSKVVPLDHGGYRNLLHYRMQVILRSAVRLQTLWRAKKGRQIARLAAEKQAFYHARGLALSEARKTVEAEWADKDAKPAHSVEKMKFEARVRMKQVKLRTKGNAFSREQVLALMIEEAVQNAQKEVENRFREMEEELGYIDHTLALTAPHTEMEYLKQEIAKGLITQLVRAKQEPVEVTPLLETVAANEERARKKSEAKKLKTQKSPKPGECENSEEVPETSGGTADVEELHVVGESSSSNQRLLSKVRMENMVFGRFPAELNVHGRNKEEDSLMIALSIADPSLARLQERLKQVCCGMTDFKLAELLEELPSKRHICEYIGFFRRPDGSFDLAGLELDLYDHFRMVRGSRELAEAFINIERSDLEFGLARDLVASIQNDSQQALVTLVNTENGATAKENAAIIAKKLTRMGYRLIKGDSDINDESNTEQEDGASAIVDTAAENNQVEESNPAQVLQQKARHALEERRKQARETHARMVEAMRAWKEAELSLQETERSQLEVRDAYPILPVNRTKWSERLNFALHLDELTHQEIQQKYTEILQVCQDFVDTASATALTLVREFHLPARLKSILPVGESIIDGRRDGVRRTNRLKYEAHDILFKICTDDHGRFEGSDEHAAKFGGHEVRNSGLYLRELGMYENVLLPLQCVVDFQGYRVLCSSKLPIEIITWGETGGGIQKKSKQLVHGSDNRGKTVTFQSKDVDRVLATAAARLNLSKHGVRGYQDLTSKFLHAPADLLGYINSKKQVVLLRFARAMPPEDPEVTAKNLVQSTRGMSIMWRQLRPELVAHFPSPLSSDALSCLTYCTPDWQKQAVGVEEATQYLINDVIPQFARKLSHQSHYFEAPSFNLTLEMHRHGINMRHLGLLRSCFYFRLSGTATLQYSTAEIITTEDFTREVDRGSTIFIDGKTPSSVSLDPSHRFDASCITLTTLHLSDSRQNAAIYCGFGDCRERADDIRGLLLAEMVARTFKNLLRHFLRVSAQASGTGLTPYAFKDIVVHSLNLLTGSRDGSDSFYKTHLFEGIRGRFGPRAVSEVDKQNMRKALFPNMRYIISRVTSMTGIPITKTSLERVRRFPDGYTFVADDLVGDCPDNSSTCGYRVKHNIMILDFSMASLLLLHATVKQATTYRCLVLGDAPHGYWPLCERRGTLIAGNLGRYGTDLTGKFLPGCILEGDGPILNADMNRALQLRKEARAYVTFPFVADRYPSQQEPQTHMSVELWCRCDGHESTRRVVLTLGRFSLSAVKANVWAFTINVRNIDIVACGAQVELHKWAYLVGTFDGTMLRLYVDGFLQSEVEVEAVVDRELQQRESIIQKTREDIDDQENEAKGRCFKEVEREMQLFFTSKVGRQQIKVLSQKFLDEHDFRVRLSKFAVAKGNTNKNVDDGDDGDEAARAGSPTSHPKQRVVEAASPLPVKRDLSKTSRSDFEPLAKKQLLREKFDAHWAVQSAEFQNMRRHVNDKIHKELEEQTSQDARPLRIGCLSSARRRDGKYFFHGSIAHVAYYNGVALTRDQINAHYVMGTRDRAYESDHLFGIASSRFSRALQRAPDDKQMLAKFAENVCASLKYDLDHQHAQELYKKKVKCGIQPLIVCENVHGIAEILKNLPRDPAFSSLLIYCYQNLTKIQPDYFQALESDKCRLGLKELARMPFSFFLGSRSANSLRNIMGDHDHDDDETDIISLFADVICRVLHVYPSLYGDSLTNMHWLTLLGNPRAVVYFVLAAEAGEDSRCIDMRDVTDICDDDIGIIAHANSFCSSFLLSDCSLLSDTSLRFIAQNCAQLEVLDVSKCSLVTDVGLAAIGKSCQKLLKLRLAACHQVSDAGIESVVRANKRLQEIVISFCERISDRSIATIAKSCPCLAVLEAELCIQLGSTGMKCLAIMHANPATLRRLNVSGCRRINDEGIIEIAQKCTRLQEVNVRQCDKLTDLSIQALTHNCLEMESLIMEELFAVTYKIFLFDQEGDGRATVDRNMLRRLRALNVAGCSGLNDLALGHLAHRAKQLESLNLSTCDAFSDDGLAWLCDDMFDHTSSGTTLRQIDLSYCVQLSPSAIQRLVSNCHDLVALNLSGCVSLTEEDLNVIIASSSKLTQLEVAFCREVTDATLTTMATHLSLEFLNISRCSRVTDDGMLDIAAQFTGLQRLDLSACKKLTDKTLDALFENCKSLSALDVTHCPHFSADSLARFVKRNAKVVSRKLEALDIDVAVERRREADRKCRIQENTDEDSNDIENGAEGTSTLHSRLSSGSLLSEKSQLTNRLPLLFQPPQQQR